MVSVSSGLKGTMGNNSGAGVLSLPINGTILLAEQLLFGNSREFKRRSIEYKKKDKKLKMVIEELNKG